MKGKGKQITRKDFTLNFFKEDKWNENNKLQ